MDPKGGRVVWRSGKNSYPLSTTAYAILVQRSCYHGTVVLYYTSTCYIFYYIRVLHPNTVFYSTEQRTVCIGVVMNYIIFKMIMNCTYFVKLLSLLRFLMHIITKLGPKIALSIVAVAQCGPHLLHCTSSFRAEMSAPQRCDLIRRCQQVNSTRNSSTSPTSSLVSNPFASTRLKFSHRMRAAAALLLHHFFLQTCGRILDSTRLESPDANCSLAFKI